MDVLTPEMDVLTPEMDVLTPEMDVLTPEKNWNEGALLQLSMHISGLHIKELHINNLRINALNHENTMLTETFFGASIVWLSEVEVAWFKSRLADAWGAEEAAERGSCRKVRHLGAYTWAYR